MSIEVNDDFYCHYTIFFHSSFTTAMRVLEIHEKKKKTFRPFQVSGGVATFNLIFAEKCWTVCENHETKKWASKPISYYYFYYVSSVYTNKETCFFLTDIGVGTMIYSTTEKRKIIISLRIWHSTTAAVSVETGKANYLCHY